MLPSQIILLPFRSSSIEVRGQYRTFAFSLIMYKCTFLELFYIKYIVVNKCPHKVTVERTTASPSKKN